MLVIVAAAQEPDGYLYTARTMNPKHPHNWSGPERWSEVENLSHEFYNLGHMVKGLWPITKLLASGIFWI